jgi:hypothetical protein
MSKLGEKMTKQMCGSMESMCGTRSHVEEEVDVWRGQGHVEWVVQLMDCCAHHPRSQIEYMKRESLYIRSPMLPTTRKCHGSMVPSGSVTPPQVEPDHGPSIKPFRDC